MAATDLFQEVGLPGSATNLAGSGYTIGGTSITVDSTTNWPTGTGVSFAMDVIETVNNAEVRVDGSYCEFSGQVTGATTVGSLTLEYGTPQNYAPGATTRVYIPVSSERENRLVQGLRVEHAQDGTHDATKVAMLAGAQTVTGVKTFSAAPVLPDGAVQPKFLAAGTGTSWAWQAWTPTWTNLSLGNGTVTARYIQTGKTVIARLYLEFGTTSDVTGNPLFTLPVTAHAEYIAFDVLGTATFHDSGSNVYVGHVAIDTTTTGQIWAINAAGTYASREVWTTTTPFDTTAGDDWHIQITYEAA